MSLPGKLLDLPAGRVFVHQGGDPAKPPLVLIHGFLVSHWYFKPVLDELSARFSVVGIDLPGHGESDRPPPDRYAYDLAAHAATVDQAMAALGIERATVYGHSMGGGTAITLAARFPTRVERLLVEDPLLYTPPLGWDGKLALVPGLGPFLFKRIYGRRDLANHLKKAFRDETRLAEEVIDYYWERFNRAGARDAHYQFLQNLQLLADNNGDPGRIACPTLVVWGEEDRIIPLAHGRRLAKLIPGTRLVVIPACGHSPHEERPDELLREVLPFLEGREAATPTAATTTTATSSTTASTTDGSSAARTA